MIRLLDYPQAIVAVKSENWKYLLFAQELFEDADRSPSERQITEYSLGLHFGGVTSKHFY